MIEIEEALKKTPLEPWVMFVTHREDPSRPLVTQLEGVWEATLYLVNAKGRPVWWPASKERARPTKFHASFGATTDATSNYLRARNAAILLREYAKRKLSARRAGLKAAATKRRLGIVLTGRPKGIPRALERTGKNRDRLCLDCGKKAGSHKWRSGVCNEAFKGERA